MKAPSFPFLPALACLLSALLLLPTPGSAQGTVKTFEAIETKTDFDRRMLHMDASEASRLLNFSSGKYAIGFWFQTRGNENGRLLQIGRRVVQTTTEFLFLGHHGLKLVNNQLVYEFVTPQSTFDDSFELPALQANTWYYLLLTHDRNAGEVEVYLNGVSRFSRSIPDPFDDEFIGNIVPVPANRVSINLGGFFETRDKFVSSDPLESNYTPEVNAYFHTFTLWKDVTQGIIDFNRDQIFTVGPPEALQTLANDPGLASVENDLELYSTLDDLTLNPRDSVAPADRAVNNLWLSRRDGVTTQSDFVAVTQTFQAPPVALNINMRPGEALAAYAGLLSPAADTSSAGEGDRISFRAPEYVYIDRQGNPLPVPAGAEVPLESDILNRAVARWKTVGYTVPGTSISGTDRAVDIEVTSDLIFEWQVVKEVALIMESAIPEGLESLSAGNADPAVQKVWVPEGSGEIATIDGFVYAPDSANDVRYRINGYEIQQPPVDPDAVDGRYLAHPGSSTFRGNASFDGSGTGWTVAFWLRLPQEEVSGRLLQFGNARLNLLSTGGVRLTQVGSGTSITSTDNRRDVWNHWAFTTDNNNTTTLYLNGRAVGSAPFNFYVVGNEWFISQPGMVIDLDDLRFWNRPLYPSEIRLNRHLPADQASPGLVADYNFDTEPTFDGTLGQYIYESSIGGSTSRITMGAAAPTRELEDRAFFPTAFDNSQQVPEIVLNDYAMVRWSWQKEYKIESLTASGAFDPATSISSEDGGVQDGAGVLWVREGDSAEVRVAADISDSPLQSLVGLPTGLFENVSFSGGTLDASQNPAGTTADFLAGSNEYRLSNPSVDRPGKILWNFGEPIFVARMPLGESFDPATATDIDGSSLAPLTLAASANQPFTVTQLIRETPNDATADNVVRWDPSGRQLWPVRPGQFLLEWPTADGQQTRLVQIVSGFAGDSYQISATENGTFPDVDAAFPGAPQANYHSLFNPSLDGQQNGENPLVALDPDPADRFHFDEADGLAYSERIVRDGSGEVTERSLADTRLLAGKRLEITEKSRSVLVYSVRGNPDESATGDLQRESLLVRTVESVPLEEETVDITATSDPIPEVATRVSSAFDLAGYGTPFLIPAVSNHNPTLYDRNAAPGEWGPFYPVNASEAQANGASAPIGIWYRNDSDGIDPALPNVAWPHKAVEYSQIQFPTNGPHRDKRIVIASRIGSEGVDAGGNPQEVFDPAAVSNLTVYNQPDPDAAGWNPNEEHALVALSQRANIGAAPPVNLTPEAVFALRDDLNVTSGPDYTSEPWVLAQYVDIETETPRMVAWKVEQTRNANVNPDFNVERRPDLYPALDYDSASSSFLDATAIQPANPTYDFQYAAFAGEPLRLPYPLGEVTGAVLPEENTATPLDGRRVFWKDHKGNPWVVSGRPAAPGSAPEYEARFDARFWYPLRGDFWFDLDGDGSNDVPAGTAIPWLPTNGVFYSGQSATEPEPVAVRYEAFWKNDYPVLKTGETLTYPGGEFQQDNPVASGLPGVVGWAAAQLVFDTNNPTMANLEPGDPIDDAYAARFIRPLDEIRVPLEQLPAALDPANGDILVRGSDWFFNELSASLQKRVYYDSLSQELVLRGLLNDRSAGDPELTATPVSLYVLEPNVLTQSERTTLEELDPAAEADWLAAINTLYHRSRNPGALDLDLNPGADQTDSYYPGLMQAIERDGADNFLFDTDSQTGLQALRRDSTQAEPLLSLGSGAALITSPHLLRGTSAEFDQPLYVTLAENNHPSLGDAPVGVHVVRISPQRFRGAVKLVEAPNALDEKITLRHTADFGGAVDQVVFDWYSQEVGGSIPSETPDQVPGEWFAYTTESSPTLDLVGQPEKLLADQWVFARYRLSGEADFRPSAEPLQGAAENDWLKSAATNPAPYQWAGANNSPQIQTDGTLRYLAALAPGWVKRVLDRVNAYEARIADFYNNESPATYTSMIQQAGARPRGPVALNADKDVIENVGLIALYQTVLDRALDLVAGSTPTDGVQQALLLAATRISDFYMLLGNEAYSDALDPTIGLGTDSVAYGDFASTVWAFQNQESSLLNEELALLRGTDFAKAWPVDNRLLWNFTKGEGEAAYATNYQISDSNADGFINEFDAAELYPQGHGDAWGHYLSSLRTHYRLLQSNSFSWVTRSEFYVLADNVLEIDYLDEAKFAASAAAKARAGSDIVRQTYRSAYTADPAGQWQGYTDTDTDRAWGLKGWAKRAGQGAYFDWLTSNSLLPDQAPDPAADQPAENLEQLDRQSIHAPSGIAAALGEIQSVLDDAANGLTPLGVAEDAVPFDIDPARLDRGALTTASHFEQVYERAATALENATRTFDYANRVDKRIRQVATSTEDLARQALDQDLAFRNRLKQVFGTPYPGTIGPGRLYPEGYLGPDLILWLYVNGDHFSDYLPPESSEFIGLIETDRSRKVFVVPDALRRLYQLPEESRELSDFFSSYLESSFNDFVLANPGGRLGALIRATDGAGEEAEQALFDDYPLPIASGDTYGFQAPDSWGDRAVTGTLQTAILRRVTAQNKLAKAVDNYEAFLRELTVDIDQLYNKQTSILKTVGLGADLILAQREYAAFQIRLDQEKRLNEILIRRSDQTFDSAIESVPQVVGASNDTGFGVRSGLILANLAITSRFELLAHVFESRRLLEEFEFEIASAETNLSQESLALQEDLRAMVKAVRERMNDESTLRHSIASAALSVAEAEQSFRREVDKGVALLEERQTLNQGIAAQVQRERYNDMTLRVLHNDALQKYREAFELAARYAYLAAKAYAFETNLDDGDPASARGALTDIVAARLPGRVAATAPQLDGGGLAGVLARLKANYDALEGRLGFNNPEAETGRFSLRRELFRVEKFPPSDSSQAAIESARAWRQSLSGNLVANLWDVPEFRRYCRAPWPESDGAQPGIVIPFSSEIFEGRNFFGWPLGGGDQSYDASRFSTKIRSAGVWLEGYDGTNLAVAPRVWLVPAGNDVLRIPDSPTLETRPWNVLDQAIPAPFTLTNEDLDDDRFLTGDGALGEPFAAIRRFSRFRAYHNDGDELFANDELVWNSRLAGRSVWNTRWLLIIPGSTLGASPQESLRRLIGSEEAPGIRDIRLLFETYSASGN